MKLYYTPGTCSLACWIALEWAGADYEVERVDPKSDSYRRINPLGMVPAIDIGGARPMTQAGAILNYIADSHPAADLGPDQGDIARLEFEETMSFLTGDFHPAFWPFFAPQRFTTQTDEASLAAVREASHARVARVLEHLDGIIGARAHVYRDRRTVADAYAFVMARWSVNFPKSWRDHANLARFIETTSTDPQVVDVLERSRK